MLDPVISATEHDRLKTLSLAVFKNGSVFPVAVAFTRLVDGDGSATSVPTVAMGLGGRLHANRILDSLQRLETIGAVAELPHPGPPIPRKFERRPSVFWSFVQEYCFEDPT
jgi:hypothetical protein